MTKTSAPFITATTAEKSTTAFNDFKVLHVKMNSQKFRCKISVTLNRRHQQKRASV